MSEHHRFARSQRMTIINGALAFTVLIVVIQLWLLSATMNAFLGGELAIGLPAAIVSIVCLGLNIGLLRYLYRLE